MTPPTRVSGTLKLCTPLSAKYESLLHALMTDTRSELYCNGEYVCDITETSQTVEEDGTVVVSFGGVRVLKGLAPREDGGKP